MTVALRRKVGAVAIAMVVAITPFGVLAATAAPAGAASHGYQQTCMTQWEAFYGYPTGYSAWLCAHGYYLD